MDLSDELNFAQAQMYTYHIYISGYHPDSLLGLVPPESSREFFKSENFNRLLEKTKGELITLGYKESNEVPELVARYEEKYLILREAWRKIFIQQNYCDGGNYTDTHRDLELIAWRQFIAMTACHFK
jgi:hypothetical protein